jgi:ATP-dependent RNA helicase SUPV3L1/SUV3
MQIDTSLDRPRLIAVLGPTNTGKTHLAMERMLAYTSGVIGFPLRLLARENFDRAVAIKGHGRVALITGEEKIVPPGAKYFLCTIESMPLNLDVDFVGIDEIQMCADPERGHIFTDRLLFARGKFETMFMGADTIRPLMRHLIPKIKFETRPRLSSLTYAGERKTSRMRPRSAVVAFNTGKVYALAEQIRRQRGGAAVVLGALSPRARNAQIEMYQNGEVDYLVATDAIGMGLNMDVSHVAFAATRKYDGRSRRPLTPSELAQIAGRAGRYMNDGTFGVTDNTKPIDGEVVEQIENHRFESLEFLYWRNSVLDFSKPENLLHSLAMRPLNSGLLKVQEADDEIVLKQLTRMTDIAKLATSPAAISLLWDVCHIPDFGQLMSDAHAGLLSIIYRHLMGSCRDGTGHLPTDWFASQVSRLDNTQGDIETISGRIACIRTWTYISYQSNWLKESSHWQNATRAIEDKLSDALHRGLTQRFVDKHTAVLVSRIKETDELLASINLNGNVTVEGHFIGCIEGFRFQADAEIIDPDSSAGKKITNAALRALKGEVANRLKQLMSDEDSQFTISKENELPLIFWRGQAVASLKAGSSLLKPLVQPLPENLLESNDQELLRRRCQTWIKEIIDKIFSPLTTALSSSTLSSDARGLIFRLGENLGSLERKSMAIVIETMSSVDRKSLKPFGVRIGRHWIFIPTLLKPHVIALRGILWGLWNKTKVNTPPPGRVSFAIDNNPPIKFYGAIGYAYFPNLVIRCDIVERLASSAWMLSRKGSFKLEGDATKLLALAGCNTKELVGVLSVLGYKNKVDSSGKIHFIHARPLHTKTKGSIPTPKQKNKNKKYINESPFAALQDLMAER